MTGSRRRSRRRLLAAFGLGVVLAGVAGGVLAFDVLSVLSSETVGQAGDQDSVQFQERATTCGFTYETVDTGPGSSAGSGDGAVAVADYNRDGYPDLLALGGTQPVLFRNTGSDGTGGFEQTETLPSNLPATVQSPPEDIT